MVDSSFTAQPGGGSGEPPLDLPYYRAPFGAAVRRFFRKYATFSGRASRAEYWWWSLVTVIVTAIVQSIEGVLTGNWGDTTEVTAGEVVITLFSLATLVPTLAVTWRRLHDINRTGLWFFFGLIPIIGWITLFVFTLLPPAPEGRRFDQPTTTTP